MKKYGSLHACKTNVVCPCSFVCLHIATHTYTSIYHGNDNIFISKKTYKYKIIDI